jgi:molybdenum cofactor cytidylyltransferase
MFVNIAAIILAAGRSRRMGTQKLLLPLGGQTIIENIVDQILAGGVRPLIAVIGPEGSADSIAIAKALSNRPIAFVHNPDPEGEMLSSVRCGLRALPPDCEAALVALGDQPSITTQLVEYVLRAYRTQSRGIVRPMCGGKGGHPTLISARYFGEILNQHDGVGLRGLLEAHANDIDEVPVTDADMLADMDYPADYERYLAALSTREKPSQ